MSRSIWILGAVVVGAALTIALELIQDTVLVSMIAFVLASVGVMAFGLAWRREQRLPWICDPLFLSVMFLSQFYVVGAIAYRVIGVANLPFMREFPAWRAIEASAGFFFFVSAMVLGYHSSAGVLLERMLPDFSKHPRALLSWTWGEAAVLIGSIAGCFGWIEYQGGLWEKLQQGYTGGKAGGAIFMIAHLGLMSGTFLTGWRVFSKTRAGLWDRMLLGGLLVFDALFFGLILGVRKYLFFLYFGLIAIWVLRRGWRSLPKMRIAAALTILLVFFSFWGTIRSTPLADLVRGSEDARIAQDSDNLRPYVSGLTEPFSIACLVWDLFPTVEPYRHGETLLVTLLGFIPRAVWKDKPVGIGKEITRYVVGPFYQAYYGFSVTVTLPADAYLNFGWLGVVLCGMLLGVVCRTMTLFARTGAIDGLQHSAARVLIPSVFVVGLGEVRSDMATMLSTYILAYAPILFVLVVFRPLSSPRSVRVPAGRISASVQASGSRA